MLTLLLPPSLSSAPSLPIKKESEKMGEEVKEVRGTMWIESLIPSIKQCY